MFDYLIGSVPSLIVIYFQLIKLYSIGFIIIHVVDLHRRDVLIVMNEPERKRNSRWLGMIDPERNLISLRKKTVT